MKINFSDDVKWKLQKSPEKPAKNRKIVTREEIPKTFIEHIVRLGFQESDARVLFENKEDWMGLTSGQ